MSHPGRALVLLVLSVACLPSPLSAQTVGTFRWQLQPYCNLVTVVVEQVGPVYRLTGTDDQCGAGSAAAVNGEAHLTSGTSVALGFTIVTTPTGAPVHVSADITLPSANGSWSDSRGVSGAFVLLPAGSATGSPRPQPVPPLAYGATLTQPTGGNDRALSAVVTSDTGPALYQAAAIHGRFGASTGNASPGNAGVHGESHSDTGVLGTSYDTYGAGVRGFSQLGYGVAGHSEGGTGVFASSAGFGTALAISNGAIKVEGPTRPVFRHVSSVANVFGNLTHIDHPLTNLDPTAMLVVTHEFAAGAAAYIGAVGIYYDNTQGKWAIFREDTAAMPTGMIFNVLVVKQ